MLGDYFDKFIAKQVETGKYASASEVIRAALRLFEQEGNQKKQLIKELKKGEKSGIVQDFDPKKFLAGLHAKHVK